MKNRESSFELLRVVSMFLIILHHLMLKFASVNYLGQDLLIEDNMPLFTSVLNAFGIVGVNVFVMISGYFGIHSIRRSVSRLLVTWIWCAIFLYVMSDFTDTNVVRISYWWYFQSFLLLIFLSDPIENALKDISFRRFSLWILLFLILNCYFGYVKQIVNTNGYNYANFVFVYLIGRYIKVIKDKNLINKFSQRFSLLLYLILSVTIGVGYGVLFVGKIDAVRFWSYNNPAIVLSSALLVLCFTQYHFYSRYINFFAKGCFAFYLLHTKQPFHDIFINPQLSWFWENYSMGGGDSVRNNIACRPDAYMCYCRICNE